MRRHGIIRRMTAALLATVQLDGCAGLRLHEDEAPSGGWLHPEGVAPADVVNDWHPDRLRVVRSDSTVVELAQPASRGDTLVGWTTVPARKGTFALDRSGVLALQVRGLGATLTLRDSSIVDIEELWERGDSLGGAGKRRSRREFVAIPLGEVARIEALHLSKPAQRAATATGALELSLRDTIRVLVGDPNAPKDLRLEYRGTLRHLANDTLVLAREDGLLRLPLAEIHRIEVYGGTHGHAATGLLVGLLVGGAGAAGVAASYKSPPPCTYICDRGNAGLVVLYEGGLVAIGGIVLGTLVGAGIRTERWHKVPLPKVQPH
jgi:hypothetical protein